MRGVLFHGVLAVLGLFLAYRTYTRPPETDAPDPLRAVIAQCDLGALREIRFEDPTHYIAAKPEGQGDAKAFWITARRKTESEIEGKAKSPSKDGITPPAPTPADKPTAKPTNPDAVDPAKPRRFLANEAFAEYLERLSPLTAARALGQLPKDKLKELGFEDVGMRLAIECGKDALQLEIGDRTFGTSQRYVRDGKGNVFMVDDSLVTDFQSSQFKFLQSSLHAFKLADVDEIVVEAKAAQKKLQHRDRLVPERAQWVDASAPTTRNELYGNWLSRLERLRVREFLAQGQEPGADLGGSGAQVTPLLTVRYTASGKPKGTLDLVRVDTPTLGRYYARSETTGTWVSVFDSTAKDVEQDVGLLVGVDEAKPAPAVAPRVSPAHAAEPHAPAAP